MHLGFVYTEIVRDAPPGYLPGSVKDWVSCLAKRTNLRAMLLVHRAAILRRRTLAGRSPSRAGTIGADVQ